MSNIYGLTVLSYKQKRGIEITTNDYYNLSVQEQSIKKIPKVILNDITFLNLISIHDNLLIEFQDIALQGKLSITMEEVMDVIFDAVNRNHHLIRLVKPIFISRNLGNMILDTFENYQDTFDINIFLSMPDKIRSQHYQLVTRSIKTYIKTLKVLKDSVFWDSYEQSSYPSMLLECLGSYKIEDIKKYIIYIPLCHRPNINNNRIEYSDNDKPSTFNRLVKEIRRKSKRYSSHGRNNNNTNTNNNWSNNSNNTNTVSNNWSNNLSSKSDNNLQHNIHNAWDSYDSFDETSPSLNNSDSHQYQNIKY